MKKYITSFIILVSCSLMFNANAQTSKKVFKYSYDATGNRTQRIYVLATPCNGQDPTLSHPDCLSRKKDTTISKDSVVAIAQNIEIELPKTPTEKLNFDGTAELKNIYPNPTANIFVLEFTQLIQHATLQILDIKGNKFDEIALDGIQWEIDMSLFAAGEYILMIRTQDGKVYNKKLVKI